jgi:hypothetical protein
MNTEQIEVANIPHGKFTMEWDPATSFWKAQFDGFVPTDAVLAAFEKMKFKLLMMNEMATAQQQQQAMASNIHIAGTTPPPPDFARKRR